ncbi:DUF2231 domain-containing protein [Ignavibacterium sp.]|uniref:DUF2231 domain-containing protein n=1 Tax=Ignavibacterium sp. TaxID=2651167 RepID=UPI0022008DD6|nr:DUF2231 domain-containing protein [Ignavibacterium sp.]BDQ02566.1 MAG: hypothetical protein KatS3mg037_1141 [Ignavibacterium sp.]
MEFLAELHHKIIHFPIALLFIYPFIEAVSIFYKKEFFSFTSLVILILGIVASLAAVLTGNQALNSIDKMNPDLYELADKHYTYANIVVWLFSLILFSRIYLQIKKKYEGKWKIILLLLAFAGCYFIYQTGEYGGKTAHTRISTIIGKNE